MAADPSRYEVLAKIASGGMATVYVGRARGGAHGHGLVAIKRPHPFVATDPALREGLGREARIASLIHHPNVVSVLDVEERDDGLSLILDYVAGGTLAELLAFLGKEVNPTLSRRVVLRVLFDAAAGLHAAHAFRAKGGAPLAIVHRDVTPQNILVGTDGRARLADFGIAKIADDIGHTATNALKGKVAYLPPEYVANKTFDARSDAYSLGIVTWEALTGHRLFRGKSDADTLARIVRGGIPRLSEVDATLAPFDDIIARAVALTPSERFESVAAFAGALEQRAQALAWVGSHHEVASTIEAAVGDRVRSVQRAIDAPHTGVVVTSARDDMPTLSMPGLPAHGPTEGGEKAGRGGKRVPPRLAWIALAILVLAGFGAWYHAR